MKCLDEQETPLCCLSLCTLGFFVTAAQTCVLTNALSGASHDP